MWARIHRWLAIVLVAPLLVWMATGLLFFIKPGWERAYDPLTAARTPANLQPSALAPLAALDGSAGIANLELFDSALGPLYRVTSSEGARLFDARTGRPRSPLSTDDARALAQDAVDRSPHRDAYGSVESLSASDHEIQIRFSGAVVTVGRDDAMLSQRGADTDRIDWLYRVHYLQWTGHRGVDRVLGVLGLALIIAVVTPGLVLFFRRRARSSA